ncbi:MAG: site-2 protease family protein [Albidovulum sp.]|uniref:metalloprotease n=1 Tax=Albidovulum sp. TaxID=1872424 RepID=UPI003CBE007C
MLELLVSLSLCAGTLLILHGGLTSPRGTTIAGMDPQAMGMGLLAIIAAGYFWGPLFGVALILSVMLHEFGHVAAYRIAGHADARFRLIPLMGGVAISDQHPASQEKAFFIALMGPGICLAPMVTAYALAGLTWDTAPAVSEFLWTFALVTAAINFFNLLPFWPLDGGRCIQLISQSFWPGSTGPIMAAMAAALIVAALWLQSFLLFFFALMGAQSLLTSQTVLQAQRPMGARRGFLALSAYLFTTLAHMMGGVSMFLPYL